MPPTFKVVVAHCAVGGALSNKSPDGILICEGAMSPAACLWAACIDRSSARVGWKVAVLRRVATHLGKR